MRPRTWRTRLGAGLVLVVAVIAGLQLLLALTQAALLVDMVPGADAGLAASPALESARARSVVFGLIVLGLGLGTAAVLVMGRRREARRSARSS